jgi:hypothetical protein
MLSMVDLQVRGETGFMIMRNYLDDRVCLPRDAPVFPGFKKLLKLGAVVAV